MKKLIIALSLCVASSASMATTLCSGTAGNGSTVTGVAANFVKTDFTPKCSANTSVDFQQTANVAAAGSISTKGNQVFQGHTNGGSVAVSTTVTCASSGCTAANAVSAADAALAAGSS